MQTERNFRLWAQVYTVQIRGAEMLPMRLDPFGYLQLLRARQPSGFMS
jgi:hypothetical protein